MLVSLFYLFGVIMRGGAIVSPVSSGDREKNYRLKAEFSQTFYTTRQLTDGKHIIIFSPQFETFAMNKVAYLHWLSALLLLFFLTTKGEEK